MRIGSFDLADRVLLIAEIGNNHEGDRGLAEELVAAAAASGAHAVKFQTYRTESFVSRREQARFQRLRGFELSFDDFALLREAAERAGLLFLSTPLDLDSAEFLARECRVDALKVASGDATFVPLLRRLAALDRPILLSTGMSDPVQIHAARRTILDVREQRRAAPDLALLHCVSAYPVPPEQANVAAVSTLARLFPEPIGYSDHTIGDDAALAAVALGARIVEKHFTIAHDLSDFRDHRLSATPPELARLAAGIERVTTVLGSGEKVAQPCEASCASAARRSIAAAADLAEGTTIESRHLAWLRPAGGLPPGEEDRLIGRRLRRGLRAGEPMTADVVEEE